MKANKAPMMTETELKDALGKAFSPADVRFILRNYQLHDIPKSRTKEAVLIYSIIQSSPIISSAASQIADLFNINKGNFSRALNKTPQANGRPTKLTEEMEEELLLYIQLRAEARKPCTNQDIRNFILEQFSIDIVPSWINNFIKRHNTKLAHSTAFPQEKGRFSLPRQLALKHISNLKKYVDGLPTELVFNLDEVGHQPWADKKFKKVIVPMYMKDNRIEYSIDRSEKRVSMIITISMAGDSLMPLIVTHRKTLDEEVKRSGMRIGEDFMLEYQESAFVTKEIFSKYISSVFIPYVQKVRENPLYTDKSAALLCDNCSAHFDEKMIKLLSQNNIRLITLPPHSSHLFQPLDLVIFGVFKSEMKFVRSKYKPGTQLDRISRLLKAIERATISENNRSSFGCGGLEINTDLSPHIVVVNEQTLLKIIDNKRLIDNPNLRSYRKFGFINKNDFK